MINLLMNLNKDKLIILTNLLNNISNRLIKLFIEFSVKYLGILSFFISNNHFLLNVLAFISAKLVSKIFF